jgi:hypothetical protein
MVSQQDVPSINSHHCENAQCTLSAYALQEAYTCMQDTGMRYHSYTLHTHIPPLNG